MLPAAVGNLRAAVDPNPSCAWPQTLPLRLPLQCACLAALQDLRAKYAQLFAVSTMLEFMWQEPGHLVAYFVHRSLKRVRQAMLAAE